MAMIQQLLFLAALGLTSFLLFRRVRRIRANILLGRAQTLTNQPAQRWRNVLLLALGQKKMFKKLLPAFLHLLIYGGFLLINLEVLEIVLDGLLGTHRIFAPWLGTFYPYMISFFEVLALGVLLACVVFLVRRTVWRVPRFAGEEMKAWPRLDANLILIIEAVLMLAILKMNAADQLLQGSHPHYIPTGSFLVSSALFVPFLEGMSEPILLLVERGCWWLHILGIMAFAVYITYSKHLHIFMAFPNAYFARLEPVGKLATMPEVSAEVRNMLGLGGEPAAGPVATLGAKDVNDLSWKNLMDAYACTECGRCTQQCPAHLTGKKLSPRKIMMDTRDRLEEIGSKPAPASVESKNLFSYISKEELNACTTCNACVEACPVSIDPLSIIVQMRRYVAMEESGAPQSWNAMFSNLETSMAPWKFPSSDRFKWAEGAR
ncbi:MAG: (Fe-S)-binding protein [Cytophagales bacterium]|nr:(Fe-S)-binding protein [Cytophagales bacterium]